MLGKQKCRILREIRQKIADENDIPYVTRECSYQGTCRGTCPRCESELRYLEEQLAQRAALGKKVTVAALCAGMSFAVAGCSPAEIVSKVNSAVALSGNAPYKQTVPSPGPEIEVEMGEVAWPEPEDVEEPSPDRTDIQKIETYELSGMMPYESFDRSDF